MSILSLGKQSLVYGFGHILSRLLTFFLLPLLTHSLQPEDYGMVAKLFAFIGFAMTFYRYGMDTALMKFYIQSDNPKSYFSSILSLQILTSILFSLILILFKSELSILLFGSTQDIFIIYAVIIIFCDIIWNLIIITLRTTGKAFQFVSFNIINVSICFVLTVYFVNIKNNGVEGVLLANLYASLMVSILSCLLLWNRFSIKSINLAIINKIIQFGLPFLPAAIFAIIMESSDRFILSYMLNDYAVGIYSAGYKFGVLSLLIVMAFNMGWTPYFLKQKNNHEAYLEFSVISTLFLGLLGFLGILITAILPFFTNIQLFGYTIIGEAFFDGLHITPIILMSYYFFGMYVLLLPKIYNYDATYLIPYFRFIGAAVNILLNILLIPKMGLVGSAFATLLSFLIMACCIFYKGNKIKYTQYNLKGWIFPLIVWGMILMINNQLIIISIIILYPICWYKYIINEYEKSKILELLK